MRQVFEGFSAWVERLRDCIGFLQDRGLGKVESLSSCEACD